MANDVPLRIGNASGFYGDRFSAVREMLEGGPLDVLTGDYLAELTMLILGRTLMKDPNAGYARTFLSQMEESLGLAMDKGVRIVSNAGGLNPKGLAEAMHELGERLGLHPKIAYVEGDNLRERAAELDLGAPLTANAYLGGWGIAEAMRRGADVVVTGRVTDASVVVGPAAAHFGWARDDWDRLAGATVAGHILECGAQATGGNYAFFKEIDARHPGFPLAEIHADGSSVITKHPGTGGAVTVETVTAQLLYEIGGPRYAGPDVTSRFDTIELAQDGADRVRVIGRARRAAAADHEGLPQPPRRLPELGRVRAVRARHRGEGGAHPRAGRGGPREGAGGDRLVARAHRPRLRARPRKRRARSCASRRRTRTARSSGGCSAAPRSSSRLRATPASTSPRRRWTRVRTACTPPRSSIPR